MIAPANCPPNAALPAGPRGLRTAGPQIYGPGSHSDMAMQPVWSLQVFCWESRKLVKYVTSQVSIHHTCRSDAVLYWIFIFLKSYPEVEYILCFRVVDLS